MSLGEEHVAFIRWCESQGIKIHGVSPAGIPGRRLGMIATRRISAGETIVTVPLVAMLTIDSVPPSFVRMFSKATPLHAILAAFFTHGDPVLLEKWEYWRRVWPLRHDFEKSLPLFWSEMLPANESILPPSVSGSWSFRNKKPEDIEYGSRYTNILSHQKKRLQDAWSEVLLVFPHTDWNFFSYNWLILNTRSFFYVSPEKDEPEDWNDAIALVPFADYFNHDDKAPCEVNFNGEYYTFKASRRFEKGEELFISYGSHSNDFLLVEYGFLLDDNKSDAIFLDDIVLPELATANKKELLSRQLYGDYKVTSSGFCNRTKAAACMKYMTNDQWRDYILGRSQGVENRTASVLHDWIGAYLKKSMTSIKILEDMQLRPRSESQYWEKDRIDILLRRWNQIRVLCVEASKAISS
ncbi:conserved hypothetical protein [Talaromyces stipitatus ATCC 10500]|uniref:SET domain-containing protein n=1 Tax=Talaromyces stipitatus (strain ATCC 10500 / CBS 375.48 / QM 6759 / NRRL 1006) TaxID=441959 RepID=B8MI52_TALSN|nr:uncharacterized protein TSTA_022680 [Talaromyces stipitatus ATCC 10500]EED17214.1 conserved hypothetical protein [Talaromyces stipitatus ATCC 10500]